MTAPDPHTTHETTAVQTADPNASDQPSPQVPVQQPNHPAPGQIVIPNRDQAPGPARGSKSDSTFGAKKGEHEQTRRIALVNQKGGVGKTTTTATLGTALARMGKRVLLVDLDPQAHLTLHMGIEPDSLEKSIYNLLTDSSLPAATIAQEVGANLVLLPAEVNLAGVEPELASLAASGQAQRVLKDKCDSLLIGCEQGGEPFDFVLIDCPPSLGLLTLNALTLAHEVIVPMQAHFLALQGLSKLLETITLVKQSVNPDLIVAGIILCMHESQTILASEVISDLQSFLTGARDQDLPWRDAVVFDPPIRRNIKLAECPSFGKTIFDYAPGCPGAGDYGRLAQAVADHYARKGS